MGDRLIQVGIEDRDVVARRPVVDLAHAGVEYPVGAECIDSTGQPPRLRLSHRVVQVQPQRQHRGELLRRRRVVQRRGHHATAADPQHHRYGLCGLCGRSRVRGDCGTCRSGRCRGAVRADGQ
jgi:hypothetical protein